MIVIGIDEVGRGALAGPVVAAAVGMRSDTPEPDWWRELRDSKELSRRRIVELAARVATLPHQVGLASAQEVDVLGIHGATGLAMVRALEGFWKVQAELKRSSDASLGPGSGLPLGRVEVYVDGNSNFGHEDWTPVVRGDQKMKIISAASIIAKWTRDRLMRTVLHPEYPCYMWCNNMGYGTRVHCEAVARNGISPYHRRSWSGVQKILERAALGRAERVSESDRERAADERTQYGHEG